MAEQSRSGPDRNWHRTTSHPTPPPPAPENAERLRSPKPPRERLYRAKGGLLSHPRPPRLPAVLAGDGREQSEAHPGISPLLAAWPLPPPPGQEEAVTTQNLAPALAQSGAPAASGGRRSLPQPDPLYPARPTSGAPPASALRSFFLPSFLPLPPSPFSLSSGPHAPRQRVSAAAPRSGEMALELSSRPLLSPHPQLPGKASAESPAASHPQRTAQPTPDLFPLPANK